VELNNFFRVPGQHGQYDIDDNLLSAGFAKKYYIDTKWLSKNNCYNIIPKVK